MWLAFFASFAVKMPMWPVHTWLPDAHVQAPTAGSVVLAAILLKMGGYGFLRFSVPMFPVASELMANFVFTLSVIAIIYTSLVAMVQEDMKKLIAYSSVAHMGFVTMGIFALNRQGIDGAIFQMISHGFVSGALFLVVGVLYDRMHTREIAAYGGLAVRMPVFALVFMLFTLANVGLPGTSGFVGEFLTLAGAFQVSTWVAFFATSGVILSACYALWLYRRVVFGDLIKESLKTIQDMGRREKLIFAPLVVAMIAARGLSGADPRHHRPVGGGADRPYPGGAGGFRPDARRELKGPAMLAENLNVVLPEAVLAVFAMAMLLWGAYAGREVGRHVLWASCIVLALVGLWVGFQPAGTAERLRRLLRQRRLRALLQGDDPVRRRRDAGAEQGVSGEGRADEVRVPGADPALRGRHDDHGLGAGSPGALHRARAAVAGALRRRGVPARQPALDRGGAEVFRARGAVLGAAALRREPHLRLFRHHRRSPGSPRRSGRGRCRWG